MIGKVHLWTFFVMATLTCVVSGFRCKWSNEGCSAQEECCSGSCEQSHPGTNSRCTKSTIRKPCLYDYHCENRLICGDKWTCCADYWETCSKREDCCNPEHKCLSARGFVYRKCLLGPERKTGGISRSSAVLPVFDFRSMFPMLLTFLFVAFLRT